MKVVLCQRGNVRSATTVAVLRDCYGETDVFAIGVDTMTTDFLNQLPATTDVWIVGDASVAAKFQQMHPDKPYTHLDIGPDHWLAPMHPDLIRAIIQQLKLRGYSEDLPLYGTTANYMAANIARWNQLHGAVK